MKYPIMFWVCNGLHYAMWTVFLNSCLRRRYGRTLTYAAEAVCVLIILFATTSFSFMSAFNVPIVAVLLILMSLALYKEKIGRILFAIFALLAGVAFNELISMRFFPDEALMGQQYLMNNTQMLEMWVPYLTNATLIFMLLSFVLNKSMRSVKGKDYLVIMLFPLSQVMLLFGWLDMLKDVHSANDIYYFSAVAFLCILSDLAVFYAISRISNQSRLEAENDLLEKQIDSQDKHYAALTAQYESIRHMRHDIANHLCAMQAMLESGRVDEASDYLSDIGSLPYDSSLGLCENPVADAFLHSRISEARKRGIEVKPNVKLPQNLPVANLDLIKALGNLLDNAEDACTAADKKEIILSCAPSAGFLVIVTENEYLNDTLPKKRRIAELDRGIGSKVLKGIAEKYNGSFSLTRDKGRCRAELVLKIGEIPE